MIIGTWLIFDKYAVDNLAAATATVQGYEKDDGLRDLVYFINSLLIYRTFLNF